MGLHTKLFIGVYLLFWISVGCVYAILPPRMASHFDASGHANGWSTPLDYVILMVEIGVGLPCLIYLPITLLPVSLMNIPNKAYWNTPERNGELKLRMKKSALETVILIVALLPAINFLVIYANQTTPPNLPTIPMFAVLGLFILGIILQTTVMFKRLTPDLENRRLHAEPPGGRFCGCRRMID